jgi:hypothetical protein
MSTPSIKPTKGYLDFINEKTRDLLSQWAHEAVQGKSLNLKGLDSYVEHAVNKGWLTKSEPRSLTSDGFKTAAAFLRR